MALPGMRGYGMSAKNPRGRNIGVTNNSNGVISALHGGGPPSAQPRQAKSAIGNANGGGFDPVLGRRIDSMELRMAGYDQANRALLEQLMKLNQDIKMELNKKDQMLMEEKNQRMRMETALQVVTSKMVDNEDRLKRAEDIARENKNALTQLINHTKNVERAITMSQTDTTTKKEMEAQRIQELNQKIQNMNSAREQLERVCYNLRDEVSEITNKVDNMTMEVKDVQGALHVYNKMLEAQSEQLEKGKDAEKETVKLSENVKSALEARISQLQQLIIDCQSKVNQERKEREADDNVLSQRLSDCSAEIGEMRRKRNADIKELEATTKQMIEMSDSEKQKIIVQISAVQTELQRVIDERDLKTRQSTVHRIDELEKEIGLESKARIEGERDIRSSIEASASKMKLYTDESVGSIRQMMKAELETLRTRIQDVGEATNELEIQLAETRSEHAQILLRSDSEVTSKIKVCEARIEDLGDRLRLGMGKLQAAVGESKSGNHSKISVPAEEMEQLHEEEMAGIREMVAVEVGKLEEEIAEIRSNLQKQEDLLDQRLRVHQQAGEDASIILGDKLQQKMDAVTFTQERMKRQIEDIVEKHDKVQGAPMDISDMRDRLVDVEQAFKRSSRERDEMKDRISEIETDINQVIGKGEGVGTTSIVSLQRDLDEMSSKVQKVSTEFDELKSKTEERIDETNNKFEKEIEELKKDQNKQEKRVLNLKEKLKGLSGTKQLRRKPDEDEIFEDEQNE